MKSLTNYEKINQAAHGLVTLDDSRSSDASPKHNLAQTLLCIC